MAPASRHDGTMEARLAALEESVDGIKADLELQRLAWNRRSDQFRDLELAVNTLTTSQKNARSAEALQYRRLELRIQVLTLVVGVAAIVAPISTALVLR